MPPRQAEEVVQKMRVPKGRLVGSQEKSQSTAACRAHWELQSRAGLAVTQHQTARVQVAGENLLTKDGGNQASDPGDAAAATGQRFNGEKDLGSHRSLQSPGINGPRPAPRVGR